MGKKQIRFGKYERTKTESSIWVQLNNEEPVKVTARPPVSEHKMRKRITSNT